MFYYYYHKLYINVPIKFQITTQLILIGYNKNELKSFKLIKNFHYELNKALKGKNNEVNVQTFRKS